MSFQKLPRPARLLWYLVLLAGTLVLLGTSPPSLATCLSWLPVLIVGECFWIRTNGQGATISTAAVAHLAALSLLPVGQVTLLAFAVSVAADLSLQRKPLIKALYNASLVAVTLRVASVAFSLERLLPTHGRLESAAMAFLGAGVLYWFVNRVGVAAIIALASRIPIRQAWRDNFGFGYEFLSTSVQVVLAGILAAGWPILGPTGLAGMGLLLFFVNDAYRRRNQLEDLATHEPEEKKAA